MGSATRRGDACRSAEQPAPQREKPLREEGLRAIGKKKRRGGRKKQDQAACKIDVPSSGTDTATLNKQSGLEKPGGNSLPPIAAEKSSSSLQGSAASRKRRRRRENRRLLSSGEQAACNIDVPSS